MDSLSKILSKQAGFELDTEENVVLGDTWCTLEVQLLIQLVAAWCLEKNRRYLFSYQATKEILKDFDIPDPKQEQTRAA